MKMMCSQCRRGLAEPVHDLGPIREIDVADLMENADGRSRCFQIRYDSHDVNDGLGGHGGDRGAAHVFDGSGEPSRQHAFEERTLGFKFRWPERIIRENLNRCIALWSIRHFSQKLLALSTKSERKAETL